MAKAIRKIWGGILEYEDDDTPLDVRAFNEFGKSTALWLEQSRELYRASMYIMDERQRKPNEIAVPLVMRGHRFLGLTPEGLRVLDWAQQILRDYDSLREELSALKDGLTGTLRVGVIPAALLTISMLTTPFCAQHPAVEVEVQSLNSRTIQRGLEIWRSMRASRIWRMNRLRMSGM
jgi:hypothetical protein